MADLSVNDLIKQLRTKSKSGVKGSKKAATEIKKTGKLITAQNAGVELCCPYCKSVDFVKNGDGRYRCKKCKRSFRPTSQTLLEGYDFTHDEWLDIIGCVIDRQNNRSFTGRVKYEMSRQKAWKLRLKILSAFLNMPQPVLTGIVQVDGTYFRESQKSSKNLKSFVYKGRTRMPRLDYVPSVSGIFGQEFICCVAGIDNTSHVFAKCISLGTPSYEELKKLLDEQITKPSYLCSDGHFLYEDYCDDYSIVHHVTPSTYKRDFLLSGGIEQNEKYHPDELSDREIKTNEKVEKRLYEERSGPHIRNSGSMSFNAYEKILANQGKDYFGLKRINEFHGDLKKRLVNTEKCVSSRLLQAYIALEVYLKNFTVDHGHGAGSKLGDYEIIFNDVMKYYKYEDYKKLLDNSVLPLKYNERANKKARDRLIQMRSSYKVNGGIFENDKQAEAPNIFNRRQCFRSMSPHRINYLCRYFRIDSASLSKTQKCDALASLPNADEIIFREIYLLYFASDEEIIKARNEGFFERPAARRGRPARRTLLINQIYSNEQLEEIKQMKRIFLDTETTGLYKDRDDEILTLSIIDQDDRVLIDKLYKPDNITEWPEAERINNISPDDVRNKQSISRDISLIQAIFDNADMIVGFNLSFDLLALEKAGVVIGEQIQFDVMKAHQQLQNHTRPHKLTKVAKFYGYGWEPSTQHTSLGDTRATKYCFDEMFNK